MKMPIVFGVVALIVMTFGVNVLFSQDLDKKKKTAAFTLAGVEYFHRFSNDNLHEYTPAGQDDLMAWKDMVTINIYPQAKDEAALAQTAEAVLNIYKENRAQILTKDYVPRLKDKPAEHLIVAGFGRPEFIEVTFARFKIHDSVGRAVIYSRRVYGKKNADEMNAWLEKNGMATEKALMKWDEMPKLTVRNSIPGK